MKRILNILTVLLLLTCLCACSSKQEEEKLDLSGDWRLIRADSEDNPVSEEDIETMHSLGMDFILSLKEDGTGTLDMLSVKYELTYDVEAMKITMDDVAVDMRYEEGFLILEENGTSLVFERIPEE